MGQKTRIFKIPQISNYNKKHGNHSSRQYKKIIKDKIQELQNTNQKFILHLDEWSDSTYRRLLNIILISGDNILNLGLLPLKGSQTAGILADNIKGMLASFNIIISKDIVAWVFDGCNLMKVLRIRINTPHIICYSHTLNLAIQKSLLLKNKKS